MKINGNLTFNADGSGTVQNVFFETYVGGVGGGSLPTMTGKPGGRLVFNTSDDYLYYWNGTAWEQIASAAEAGVVSITPSGGNIAVNGFTTGTYSGAVTISFAGTLPVASGGTGDASLTAHNVLIGEGTSPVAFAAPGTQYQVLQSNGAAADPTFSSINLASSAAVGSSILALANGGTNADLTASAGSVAYSTASALALSSVGSAGNFLVSGGTGAPTWLANTTPVTADSGSTTFLVGTSFDFAGTAHQITTTATAQTVTFSVPTTFIAPGSATITTNLTVDGLTYESATTNITAHAGGGQGSATQLTTSYNVVTTVASSGDSIKLPASGVGLEITVVNLGANTVAVFPSTGDAIDGQAANASVSIPTGGTATYQSDNVGNWYTIDPVVVSGGTGISVTYSPGQTQITNTGVTSFSAGTTGLTPSSSSTGAITLAGTLVVANGGTGAVSLTAHGVLLGEGTSPIVATAVGATGSVLAGNTGADPTFQALTSIAVTSFETTLSGLSPSSASTGAITLSGTLGVASGGTGDTSLTSNGMLYGNGTSPVGVTAAGTQYQVFQAGASGVPTVGAVNLAQSAAVTGNLPLSNGGTNASLTAVAGAPVYSGASALAIGTAGTTGQAYISGGTGAPTWQTVSSTLTTNQILEGDGTGQFVANGGSFVGSGTFSGVTLQGTVTNPTDATTKAYVDAATAGLSWKEAVTAATTENFFTLTGTAPAYSNGAAGVGATLTNAGTQAALVIDGVTLSTGQRVLVKNESNITNSSATWNGIYVVTNTGSGSSNWVLTRSTDNDTPAEMDSAAVFVTDGTTNATSGWVQATQDPITIGTSNIQFSQFSGGSVYTFTSGLNVSGSTVSVRTDGVTTYIDGSNNVAVDSSAVAGQVLTSTGTHGNTAAWGAVALGNTNAVSGTLAVTNGGTGAATLTAHGVLLGEGTSAISATAVGATGSVLAGNTGADPTFQALTGIAVTSFQTSLSGLTPSTATPGAVTLAGTLGVPSGGTGDTTFTTDGVLYGNGASALGATAAGTNGQVLVGNTGAAPSFSTLSGIAVTSIAGTANEIDASASTGAVTLSLDPVLIAPGSLEVTTTTKFDGLTYESYAAVAATGTTQGTGAALTHEFNVVTEADASHVAVVLPTPAYAGAEITVVNVGTQTLLVFPASTGMIDGAGASNSISVPAGGTWTGQSASAGASAQWWSIDPVVVNGTGISVSYNNGQTSIANTGVLSFSGGTTGLTPSSATSGNITLGGTLVLANGGTSASLTASAGSIVYSTASAMAFSTVGTTGQILLSGGTGAPTWLTNSTPVDTDGAGTTDLVVGSSFNIFGTANEITTTAVVSPAGVTLSIPSTFIAPGSVEVTTTLKVDSNTASSFLYSNASSEVVTTSAPTNGQVLVGVTSSNPIVSSIQYNYDSSAHGGPLEYYTINHNLNQKYVTVQVYSQDTQYSIVSAASGGPTITISGGDFTSIFTTGTYFIVYGSSTSANNTAYTVVSSTYSSPNTVITISGSVTTQGASGSVVVGPAQIIPQSVFLIDANNIVVTLNASLNVYVVVSGVTGVAPA